MLPKRRFPLRLAMLFSECVVLPAPQKCGPMPPTTLFGIPGGGRALRECVEDVMAFVLEQLFGVSIRVQENDSFRSAKFSESFHQKALRNGNTMDVFRRLFRRTRRHGKTSFGLRQLQRNVGRAVQKVVGNRRKNRSSSHALPAFTFSSKCARKGAPKGPVWGPLGLLLLLWRPTWSSKGAKVVKKVDQMRRWNWPWHPEGPECYPRVPGTSKMEPTWSQK